LLFPDTTDATLNRIGNMPTRERLTQILLLSQLAQYRMGVRPLDERSKYTVRILYDRIFEAVTAKELEHRQPIRFDTDVVDLINTSYANKDVDWRFQNFVRDIEITNGFFWDERRKMLPFVLESGRCDMARLLIDFVSKKHAVLPEAAAIRAVPDPEQQIAAMETSMKDVCADNNGVPL
jgi:hypothetical protein